VKIRRRRIHPAQYALQVLSRNRARRGEAKNAEREKKQRLLQLHKIPYAI
jgi:hypothetical protein